MSDPSPILPSSWKLLLTLAVVAAAAYYPVKVLVAVQIVPADSVPPSVPPGGVTPAGPVAHRLFEEYPAVAADQAANPVETRAAVWVSFRHLPADARASHLAPWRTVKAFRSLTTDGLYRLECGGPVAAVLEELLARYPYAVAPGERIDPDLAAAYRRATNASPFRICVVRGDWLTATLASDRATAERFGLSIEPELGDLYRNTVLSTDRVLASFPTESRSSIVPPVAVSVRELEAADQHGHSLFVRWAKAAGAGVPLY